MNTSQKYFDTNMEIIKEALDSIDSDSYEHLLSDCEKTLRDGHKIIATGLGKNVPICDKFVGTMLSLGLNAGFLHTDSALHGDLGMVHPGDLVIVLTKSGSTSESVFLVGFLEKRPNVNIWLITFNKSGQLSYLPNKIVISLKHEGDLWNIVPNNSTTTNLIVLQTVAIEMSKRLHLSLDRDFKPNHPGGAIGQQLKNE